MRSMSDLTASASFTAEFAARQAEPERMSQREAAAFWIAGSGILWAFLFALLIYLF